MFTTIRSKLFFFITLVMLVTAGAVLFFTYQGVGDAMHKAGRESAQNVLNLVKLNIRDTYFKIRAGKIATIRERRDQLRDSAKISASVIARAGKLVESGNISEQRSREQILDWLGTIRFPQKVGVFALDQDGLVLAHTNPAMIGTSITHITDLKRRKLATAMRYDKVKKRGEYAVFHWNPPGKSSSGKMMAYFMPIADYQWTLGTVVSIEDIETEAQTKLDKAVESLSAIFADIHIAKTGCAMVLEGDRKILIPPCDNWGGQGSERPELDSKLIDAIMDAAKSDLGSAHYVPDAGQDKSELQIYANYFQPLDWYFAVYLPVEELRQPARALITRQTVVIGLIFIASLIISFFLVSRISKPLKMLANHAKEIAGHDFSQPITSEDTVDQVLGKYRDEVGGLARSFSFMKSELNQNIRELMETTATKERILGELDVARSIQMGILPKTFPPFPHSKALDLFAVLEPAKTVGGDLYDFFFIDEKHICFTIGDVSDKGVPAALFMVITRTLIKILADPDSTPAEIMVRINDTLSLDNPNSMFVTLIIGVLDVETGHVRYSNGGHNPPIVLRNDGEISFRDGISGPAVGAMEEMPYEELELTLAPGESLFLYTDGVTEAMDKDNVEYSDERLLETVVSLADKSVTEVINGVMQDVCAHASNAGYQSDDITMLMLHYNGISQDE